MKTALKKHNLGDRRSRFGFYILATGVFSLWLSGCLSPTIVGDPGCYGSAVSGGVAPYGTFQSGMGTSSDPYFVCTKTQLQSVGSYLTSYYKQKADIDLSGVFFTLIGSDTTPFTGTYDGNSKTISNFGYSDSGAQHVGLFSVIGTAGTVKNLTISGATVTGGGAVGILVGRSYGTLSNVHVSGTVTGGAYTGGVVGGIDGSLDTCSANVTVVPLAPTQYLGGVVGALLQGGNLANCTASGSISAATSDSIGGIVGASGIGTTTAYSTSTMTLVGNNYVGGIMGESIGGDVTGCVSSGSVTGDNYVGGIVGYGQSISFTISKSVATGTIVAGGSIAGAAGGIAGGLASGNIADSYYINTGAGITLNAGMGAGGVTGLLMPGYSITDSYAVTGAINGAGASKTCFVGVNGGGTISNSYYNNTTCATGAGGGTGLATAAMFVSNMGFSNTTWGDNLSVGGGAYPGLR